MSGEISGEIVKVCMVIEREVAIQKEHDQHRGMHSNIGGKLEEELNIYKAGLHREIPDGWSLILKEHDPDYQEYLRLKKKFGEE